MKQILLLVALILSVTGFSQDKVTFSSLDSLTITADFYETNPENPYVIMFHQAGYSRGEYKEIAPKINKLGYNCIAVDLRSGEESNYVINETAKLASEKGLPNNYMDAKQDMEAAINYVFSKSKKPVILFGSSYSASLSMVIGNKNDKVKAVIAFSPGEFFQPNLNIKEGISGFNKPIFIASSQREYPYVYEYNTVIDSKYKTFFKPQNGQGEHGAKALWSKSETSKEYWLALMLFLKNLNTL